MKQHTQLHGQHMLLNYDTTDDKYEIIAGFGECNIGDEQMFLIQKSTGRFSAWGQPGANITFGFFQDLTRAEIDFYKNQHNYLGSVEQCWYDNIENQRNLVR